jgi:methylmalonyl-CoA mutase
LGDFPAPDLAQWRAEVERLLAGAPFDRAVFTRTLAGVTVAPLYTAADTADLPWSEQSPGAAPYLRGATAAGHLGAPWQVAQELPLPTVEEFNEALRADLARGQTVAHLILDTAGMLGLDPDQTKAGTVGADGTSVASLADLARALDGVDLATTPLKIQAGTVALPIATMVVALLREQGVDPASLTGCIGCDPVFGLARTGRLPLSLKRMYDEVAVLTRWAARSAPRLRTLPVFETPWHDGGADEALSLALCLSSAVHVLRVMEKRGVALDEAVRRVQFQTCLGGDFFLEIAKLRALRLLWSDIQTAAGLVPQPAAVHARTGRRTQTVHDPQVNLLRSTTQAMSAVLGGVQSLHVAPFDEVDSVPDAFSRRLARNVHLLLAHESHLDRVIDPAGGSWSVEKLTADLARSAWDRFQEIEALGGVVAGLRSGRVQEMVAAGAEARRRRLATRRDVLVGTNRYAQPTEPARTARQPDLQAVHAERAARTAGSRTGQADHGGVLERLERLLEADPADLFAQMEAAGAHGATLGELVSILRHDDTPDPAIETIPLRRDAAPFEALRRRLAGGRVCCACLGDVARYMPRLDFTRDFFRVGGCEVLADGHHDDPAAAAAAALAAGTDTVVVVGLDATYAAQAADLARALKAAARPPHVILAGSPGDAEDELRAAGFDEFIHARSDVLDVLGRLADRLEVGA